MLLISESQFLTLLITLIIPVVILFVVAIILRIRKLIQIQKKGKKEPLELDDTIRNHLLTIFGGEDNIISTKLDMSRITVTVNDIDKVDSNGLKDFGATGVLLVGNAIKCSFKENVKIIYQALERK